MPVEQNDLNVENNPMVKYIKADAICIILMDKKDVTVIKDALLPVTKKYQLIKAIYLAGSCVRKTDVRGSDIDVTIIVDDTRKEYNPNLSGALNSELSDIKKQVMEKHKLDLHFQPPKELSLYWDLVRSGEPWVFTELRDALSIYDPSGFIEPLQILLRQGRISGTKEKAYALITRARSKIKDTRRIFLDDITSDLLLSMLESAQAVIMYMGLPPPSPKQIPYYLKPYVDNGFLKPDVVRFFAEFYNVTVKIDHGLLTTIKGSDIDYYLEEALIFIREMERLFEVMEALKKRDIVNQAYEKTLKTCKKALEKNGKKAPKDNYKLMIEFKRQFVDTKVVGRECYVQIKKIYANKRAADKGKIKDLTEKDVYTSNLHAKNLEIIIGDAFNGKKTSAKAA